MSNDFAIFTLHSELAMASIYPWGGSRRYNSYSNYFKKEFGGRVQKLTIDAGFTCPNRDGRVGVGGCTYCNNDAFNPSYCTPRKSILQQIEEGIEFHSVRYRRANQFMAYFQAYSNTYAPLDRLKELYDQALSHPKVVGLVIGTRPDCVDEEKLDYFRELSRNYYIAIEYGVESCYDDTLNLINRGHTFEQSVWAIEQTSKRGVRVGAHIIFGLPGETREQMLAEAQILSRLPLHTIKFHQLQIIKGTAMALQYETNPKLFNLFGMDEYFNFLADFIERLNPDFVIERFTGEAPPRYLAVPPWGHLRTDQLMARFEKLLEERDTWQGKLFKK